MTSALLPKVNRRATGAEAVVTAEAHTVGEDDAGFIYLNEAPLLAYGVTIPGFTAVAGAPSAGEFRPYYTGRLAGAIEFHAADEDTGLTVTYKGCGSPRWASDINRIQGMLSGALGARAIVNVCDPVYGAKGDGVTNDTAAIAAALVAGTGGTVYFPPGIYRVDTTLVVPASTRLVGVGRVLTSSDGAIIRWVGGASAIIQFAGADIVVEWLRIEGNVGGGTATIGIDTNGQYLFDISHNRITGCSITGVKCDVAYLGVIWRNYFEANTKHVWVKQTAPALTIMLNDFFGTTATTGSYAIDLDTDAGDTAGLVISTNNFNGEIAAVFASGSRFCIKVRGGNSGIEITGNRNETANICGLVQTDTSSEAVTISGNTLTGPGSGWATAPQVDLSGQGHITQGNYVAVAGVGINVTATGTSLSLGPDFFSGLVTTPISNNSASKETVRIFLASGAMTTKSLSLGNGASTLAQSADPEQSINASTTTTIFTSDSDGGSYPANLTVVQGALGSNGAVVFSDLLLWHSNGATATVVSSKSEGTSVARTYSISGNNLRISLDGAVPYNVNCANLRVGGV